MANINKVIKYGLSDRVVAWRDQGLTVDQIVERANKNLKLEGDVGTLSKTSIERFLRGVPADMAPAVHTPEATDVLQSRVSGFAEQFTKLNRITQAWLDEAENARATGMSDHGPVDLGPDWNARTKVAKELREQLKLMGDTMERIYNAEQIKLFQESVLDAISEVSPEVAQAIRDKLRQKTEIRRAALLGV